MVTVAVVGFQFGAAVAGILAAQLITAYGWTSVFWAGGILPLALAIVLIFALPESMKLLALRGGADRKIASILRRVNRSIPIAQSTKFTAHESRLSGFAVRHLFTESRTFGTILLWIIGFMTLINIFFLTSWLPTVIHDAGYSMKNAALVATLLQIGAIVGTFLLGWVADRFRPLRVLVCSYIAAGIFIGCIGLSSASIGLLGAAVFATGFCLLASQNLSQAVVATFYPTLIRSTGLGWQGGVGRIGSIVGPFVAGIILSFQWKITSLFFAAVIPAFCAALASFLMIKRMPDARQASRSAHPAPGEGASRPSR